jgi:hypothetical protein
LRQGYARTATLIMLLAVLSAGCRSHPVVTTPETARLSEEYCWWAVMRSPLPPDSVAARFQGAFTSVGLTSSTWTRSADTAWAHAGPTALAGASGAMYESRVVAYWHGDSTHFRHYVSMARQPGNSANKIALCQEIGRAAAVPTSVPREPTGEEALKLWTRIP